jgi:prepilin-type N-terminal cleavage/methylation domain-containing protein
MTTVNVRLTTFATSFAAGFSLVELLVALTVCALIAGAVAAVVGPAKAVFESTPDALDLQQRQRTASDLLSGALRSARAPVATAVEGAAGEAVPAVMLLDPTDEGRRFRALSVVTMAGPGRGVLDADQVATSSALRLRAANNCPAADDVCGFSKGAVAAVVDVDGRFDVFTVASTSKGARSLSPSRALARTYPAGSLVVEVSADTYRLDEQADGSSTLVRETAAGAVLPVVDEVREIRFEGWRRPPGSPVLVPVTAADLADGPWRAGGVEGEYDTDWRALRRVDITLRIGGRSAAPGSGGRTLRLSVSLRNPS